MLTLRDIMVTDVVAVGPETSLRELIDMLNLRHIGGVPVVARKRVLGVISMTDVLDHVATAVDAPEPSDAEIWPDTGIDPEEGEWAETAERAARFYTELWPDASSDLLERFAGADRSTLDTTTAADVMTRSVKAMPPESPLSDAADFMLKSGIHRLLVVEDENLVGVVTTTDFMRAVADAPVRSGIV